MRGLNSLNLDQLKVSHVMSILLHLAMFGKTICFKLQTKLLCLRIKPRRNPDETTVLTLIDRFTVVGLVTWPLNDSEAGGDLVLIQTSLLLLCRSSCSYAN